MRNRTAGGSTLSPLHSTTVGRLTWQPNNSWGPRNRPAERWGRSARTPRATQCEQHHQPHQPAFLAPLPHPVPNGAVRRLKPAVGGAVSGRSRRRHGEGMDAGEGDILQGCCALWDKEAAEQAGMQIVAPESSHAGLLEAAEMDPGVESCTGGWWRQDSNVHRNESGLSTYSFRLPAPQKFDLLGHISCLCGCKRSTATKAVTAELIRVVACLGKTFVKCIKSKGVSEGGPSGCCKKQSKRRVAGCISRYAASRETAQVVVPKDRHECRHRRVHPCDLPAQDLRDPGVWTPGCFDTRVAGGVKVTSLCFSLITGAPAGAPLNYKWKTVCIIHVLYTRFYRKYTTIMSIDMKTMKYVLNRYRVVYTR